MVEKYLACKKCHEDVFIQQSVISKDFSHLPYLCSGCGKMLGLENVYWRAYNG